MSLWIGILASAGKKLFNTFLYGSSAGKLYTIDEFDASSEILDIGSSINDIEYIPSESTMVAVGNGGSFYSSTNLTTWVSQSPANFGYNNIVSIAYGGEGTTQGAAYFVGEN
jgi:hypothetical protein